MTSAATDSDHSSPAAPGAIPAAPQRITAKLSCIAWLPRINAATKTMPSGIGRHNPAKQNQSSPVLVNFHFDFGGFAPVKGGRDQATALREAAALGALLQTAGIARRLMRGGELHREMQPGSDR